MNHVRPSLKVSDMNESEWNHFLECDVCRLARVGEIPEARKVNDGRVKFWQMSFAAVKRVGIVLIIAAGVSALGYLIYWDCTRTEYCDYCKRDMNGNAVFEYPCRGCLFGHSSCRSHGVIDRIPKEPILTKCPEVKP